MPLSLSPSLPPPLAPLLSLSLSLSPSPWQHPKRAKQSAILAEAVATAPSTRIADLRCASTNIDGVQGCLVKEVFRTYLPLDIAHLVKQGVLTEEFATRMTAGFAAAAEACDEGGNSCGNTAGELPRNAMKLKGVNRSDLEELVDALATARVEDELANAFFTLYGERKRER